MNKQLQGFLCISATTVLYSLYGVFANNLAGHFDVFFQAYMRAAIIVVICLAITWWTGSLVRLGRKDWGHLAWPCGFLLFYHAASYYAYQHAGIANTSFIYMAFYVVTAYVVGYLLLKERITTAKWLALVLALVGLVVATGGIVQDLPVLAVVLAAVSGISASAGFTALKQVPKHIPILQTTAIAWAIVLVIHLPLSLALGESQPLPALDWYWANLLVYALAGLVATWFFFQAIRRISTITANMVTTLQIVFAAVWGSMLYGEHISFVTFVGGSMILAAAVLAEYNKKTIKK